MDQWFGFVIGALIGNAILSLIVGYAAGQKGRSSVGFFWLAFLGSFIIGILVLIAVPRVELTDKVLVPSRTGAVAQTSGGTRVKCPFCAEWVSAEAKLCKHCGREIADQIQEALVAESSAQEELQRFRGAEESRRVLESEKLSEERASQRREFFASRRFKALVGGLTVVVLVLMGLGVARLVQWLSFQEQIAFVTSVQGSEERIRSLGATAVETCGILPQDYRFEFFDASESFGSSDFEFHRLYLKASGLSSETVDCVAVSMVGVPASYWPFARDEEHDISDGYLIGWDDSGEIYFGWSNSD